jgi:NTE family protein
MEKEPLIKHLVISGGGTFGLSVYSILRELNKKGFWKYENIQSFHGTSVGTIVSLLILLEYDWETMDTFLIKRPWEKVFDYNIQKCLDIYENCGAFDLSIFLKAIEPLFKGKDLELDITLKQLYDKTQKDFYLYVTELNNFKSECISHKTHPEWTVMEAVYASCCLPMIFQPLIKGDKAYADGGVFLNYPINECVQMEGVNKNEILGIYKNFTDDELDSKISNQSTMVDYFAVVIRNLVKFTNSKINYSQCDYQICLNHIPTTIESIFEFVKSQEYRKELINGGEKYAEDFLKSLAF